MTFKPIQIDRLDGRLSESSGWMKVLENQGIDVVVVSSPVDVESIKYNNTLDLVLVESNSMSKSHLGTCLNHCFRVGVPALVVTGPDRLYDPVADDGASDFVVTPFHENELIMRARHLVEKSTDRTSADTIKAGGLLINPSSYEVSVMGRRVDLRFKEYELLLLMASNPGHVYTREALLKQIWGYQYLGGTRTVDVHVRRLRSKIEDADNSFIETVWSVGYRFRESPED